MSRRIAMASQLSRRVLSTLQYRSCDAAFGAALHE
jgi:hypothetical protein